MARRRERPSERPAATKVPVPAWVRGLGAGIAHVTGSLTTYDLARDRALLEAARARWCAENGCHRAGKSCREVFNGRIPRECEAAGGPAALSSEQGEG